MRLIRLSLYACGLSTVLLTAIVANAVLAPPQRAAVEASPWTTIVVRD